MSSINRLVLILLFCFSASTKFNASSEKTLVNLNIFSQLNSSLVSLLNINTNKQYGAKIRQNTQGNAGICGRENFFVHDCTIHDNYYRCTCYTDCTCTNYQGLCMAWRIQYVIIPY